MVWFALYSSDTFEIECVRHHSGVVNDLARLCVNMCCSCEKSRARKVPREHPNMPLFPQDALFRYSSEPCDEPISMLKRRKRGKYYIDLIEKYATYKRTTMYRYPYNEVFEMLFDDNPYDNETRLHQSDIVVADAKLIRHYLENRRWICNILGYNRRVMCMVIKCLRGNIKATNDDIYKILRGEN